MTKGYQEIRPSQFITTFGPGSIVETPSGPVVLKSLTALFTGLGREQGPDRFEIVDERLTRTSLDRARIVAIPTNAELARPASEAIYPTYAFPFWALCAQHTGYQVLYDALNGCGECGGREIHHERRAKAGREAIRFVAACSGGHLDEVSWHRLVHGGESGCSARHFRWFGGGRALRLVKLVCPKCSSQANLGEAYGRSWRCSERYVENGGRPASSSCSRPARIVQRGSASLRSAELTTAVTILEIPARLHDLLGSNILLKGVRTLRRYGRLEHDELLTEAREAGVSSADVDYLERTSWSEIERALGLLLGDDDNSLPLKETELDRLETAASHGAPQEAEGSQGGEPPLFEVLQSKVREVPGPGGRLVFRVAPVSRLRTVMVQTGYRRLEPETGQLVSTAFEHRGFTWYPGVELFGEGVYLDLAGGPLPLTGEREVVWQSRHDTHADVAEDSPWRHPVHVWWHSLSHRLLWALAVDSGYSSAAIRERVYTRVENGTVTGSGLLLYTVQPGGDGTLGGLISLVDRFGRVLERALRDVDVCSNDPLCGEAPLVGADGAACYSCLYVSETSCEQRNQGLDRLLLAQNLP